MSLAFHGNYCGPNWTGGKYESAEEGSYSVEPIDDFDKTCQLHDSSYKQGDYLKADKEFVQSNYLKGGNRTFAAYIIYLQSKLRELGVMAKTKKVTKEIKAVKKEIAATRKKHVKIPAVRKVRQQSRSQAAPVNQGMGRSVGKSQTRINGKSIANRVVISGHDQIGAITVNNGYVGQTVFSFTVSPQNFTDQRLGIFSRLFDKYVFKKFVVKYRPQVGTNLGGELIFWYEYDPTDDVPVTADAVNRALASSTPYTNAVWNMMDGIALKRSLCGKEFYTQPGDEMRLVNQAIFYVTSNSAFSTTGDLSLGNLEVDYVVEFYGNELNQLADMVLANPYVSSTATELGILVNSTRDRVYLKARSNIDFNLNAEYVSNTSICVNMTLPSAGIYVMFLNASSVCPDGNYYDPSASKMFHTNSDFEVIENQNNVSKYGLTQEDAVACQVSFRYTFRYKANNPQATTFFHLAFENPVDYQGGYRITMDTLDIFKLSDERSVFDSLKTFPKTTNALEIRVQELQDKIEQLSIKTLEAPEKKTTGTTPSTPVPKVIKPRI